MNLMFFLTGDRNVEQPRLEGAQTISISFLAFVAAVFLTMLAAWFIKRKDMADNIETDYPEGTEALEQYTYVPLIKRLWARIKRGS
jgi:ABC-type Fe3+ transport system permease subunit